MQRVAITGVGLVTPLGLTAEENVARSYRRESGIAVARAFEVDGHPAQALASVAGFNVEQFLKYPKNSKFMGRSVQFAMRAAREAVDQSGIDPRKMDASRVGIHVGSGQTGVEYDHFFPSLLMAWDAGRDMDYKYLGGLPSHLIDRYICLRTLANGGLALLSTEFGIRGPNGNFTQKDTASAQAVQAAYLDLLEERCDVAIAGGYDSLATPGNFLAYEQAGLLSHRDPGDAYRPFDADADGLVLGEGAGFLVLERWDHAVRRGAKVLGELCGAGSAMGTAEQWRPAWAAETVCQAAHQAIGGLSINFTVASGLGTAAEDSCEAEALGGMAGPCPVTALKGYTGYMGAGTAAVELGLGLLCARQGFLPAVAGNTGSHPSQALDLVRHGPRTIEAREPLGLFLSCSWGGAVAALAARAMRA
jgi:3-oxoacyl-(acyl-carrier-protein) synthase